MNRDLNSHDFPKMYSELGISPDKLGCVLVDLAPIQVTSFIPETDGRLENELYVSKHPDRFWINGAVAERKAHVTLLYGLLSKDWQDHIRTVLASWRLPMFVEVEGLSVFESPYSDEDAAYSCIVANIRITPPLQEGHARLELLPHVNTFTEWKAHTTLAYVRSEFRDKWVSALKNNLPETLRVTGLDIGDQHD